MTLTSFTCCNFVIDVRRSDFVLGFHSHVCCHIVQGVRFQIRESVVRLVNPIADVFPLPVVIDGRQVFQGNITR